MNPTKKVGIFGGTFNPIHIGHVNSMLSVADRLGLTTVKVVPASQSPLKSDIEEPTQPEDRLQMVKLAIQEYPEVLELDDLEVRRKGLSYTIDTINSYLQFHSSEELYLIIGADQFQDFERWNRFGEILAKVNLIVTTRPGAYIPLAKEDFPESISELVAEFDGEMAVLNTGRTISIVKLEDKDISSTEIRKKIRTGKKVYEYLDANVERYISEKSLYNSVGDKISSYKELTEFAAQVFFDAKAVDVKGFDLEKADKASDFALVASGTSHRHTTSIAEGLVKKVKEEYGVFPYSIEGLKEGRWVVVDYGNLIVHVFYDYVRNEYRLEELWQEGDALSLVDQH